MGALSLAGALAEAAPQQAAAAKKGGKNAWTHMQFPPLEMFHWNRVVVDEYQYVGGAPDGVGTCYAASGEAGEAASGEAGEAASGEAASVAMSSA